MRTTGALSVIGLFGTALIVAAIGLTSRGDGRSRQASELVPSSANGKFVVHEWGTFTSFSGSDSVKLEFRPLVEADLPPFVLDRGSQSGLPSPFSKFDYRVLQRMETPVTYFYTDSERQVNIRVGFPQGLLTEFYPPVERMQPEFKWLAPEPVSGSALDWGKVWIVPEHRLRADVADPQLAQKLEARLRQRLLPRSTDHPHYAYARETDSALVYVERQADKQRPVAPQGNFFEKFLFYRGIGNFELPLTLSAQAGGRFELTNVGREPIRSLFLVTVEGDELRFTYYDEIVAGGRLTLAQSTQVSSADELSEAVVAALIDEHLYEKEARAMVKTWRSSWFDEPGTRLFYMLPRRVTDELLPLEITPSPDETVRVMVGRLEIMRPEDESGATAVVQQSILGRAAADKLRAENPEAAAYPLPQAILDFGRLAEPALVRVRILASDTAIRHEATQLLNELQQYRNTQAAR
jgi:hypothetical protein